MVIKILQNNNLIDFKLEISEINNVIERKSNFNFQLKNKGKYFMVRDLAWQVLLDTNVKELPVNLEHIAKHYNCLLAPYQNNMELFTALQDWDNLRTNEAFSCNISNYNIIGYNNNYPTVRKRFSIAHELGHLILKHNATNLDTDELETEAHAFATRILMPAGVLNALNVKSPAEISQLCNTSLQASTKRFERLEMLRERNKFYSSKLERQVLNNFKPYIEKNRGKYD